MAKQSKIIVGQVAAITGGARGIGKETARALIREGVRVSIGDLDIETARATAEELGAGTIALELNVTDRDSFERFVQETEEQLGPVDILINNAGIMQLGAYLDEDERTTRRMIDINVYGVHHGSQIALERFVPRGRGHLVNVASMVGKAGYAGGVTYSGTKHYVVGMSEGLRGELRGTGVEISVVMPVAVHTELGSGLGKARGVKQVEPEDVAAEIVAALKEPRFDVFVPRSVGPLTQFSNVLPRRAREGMARAMKADKVLSGADFNARKNYELRAAHSEPGLEPVSETKTLEETSAS